MYQPGVLVMCGGRRVRRERGGGGGGGQNSLIRTSAFLSVTVETDKTASSGPICSLLLRQNVHSVLPLPGEDPCQPSPPSFAPGRGRSRMLGTQLHARSTLPASVTIFPPISTATSLTANARQWACFRTRLSPNVIHHPDQRSLSFNPNEVCLSWLQEDKEISCAVSHGSEPLPAQMRRTKTRARIILNW